MPFNAIAASQTATVPNAIKTANRIITTAPTLKHQQTSSNYSPSICANGNGNGGVIQPANTTSQHINYFNFMKQFRHFKEDLELLMQRLRNLQKQKPQLNDLKQFIIAIEEFNDKFNQLINIKQEDLNMFNHVDETGNDQQKLSNSNEILKKCSKFKEYQQKIAYLIEQLNCNINSNCEEETGELNDSTLVESCLDQLYKIFNECMHLLEILPNR